MTFGELLKRHREAAGLTQKELAEASGVTQGGIAHYETGKREPTWAAVQKLCVALGVECTAFKEGKGKGDPAPVTDAEGGGSVSHPEPKPAPKKPKKGSK